MEMRIPSGELQEAVFDITLIHLFEFKTFYEELNQNQTHLVKKLEQDLVFSVKLQFKKTFALVSLVSLKFRSFVFSLQTLFSLKFILDQNKFWVLKKWVRKMILG